MVPGFYHQAYVNVLKRDLAPATKGCQILYNAATHQSLGWCKIEVIESRFKQCGVTPNISAGGQNLLKKYRENINIEKLSDRSTVHRQCNIPWLVHFKLAFVGIP